MNTIYRLAMSPDFPWYVVIAAAVCGIVGVIIGAVRSEIEYRKTRPVTKRYCVSGYAEAAGQCKSYNWLWLAKISRRRMGWATIFDRRHGEFIDLPERR